MRLLILMEVLSSTSMLAACIDDTGGAVATAKTTDAERACLRRVAEETGNPVVAVLGSEPSEAGTSVRIGVGPNTAPWQCTAYSDGSTGGVQSLTDEGYL